MSRSLPEAVAYRVIHLSGEEVRFLFRRSARRRTIGLRVDQHGLTVTAPLRVGQRQVDEAIQDQARWVLEKIRTWRAQNWEPPRWADGERLPFMGGFIELRHTRPGPQQRLALEEFRVVEIDPDGPPPAEQVIAWYRREALAWCLPRVAHFAAVLGVPTPPFALTNAKARWGSCSANGKIRLNWRLIKASAEEIDYVVAHELAHLRHMNHSAAFWQTVESILPDYRSASRKLDQNDLRYRAF